MTKLENLPGLYHIRSGYSEFVIMRSTYWSNCTDRDQEVSFDCISGVFIFVYSLFAHKGNIVNGSPNYSFICVALFAVVVVVGIIYALWLIYNINVYDNGDDRE